MSHSLSTERIKSSKQMIALCYNVVSKMRTHCSNITNFLAYAIFDGVGFWVINVKKKASFGICNP